MMAVFEAEHRGGTLHPDGAELMETQFVSEAEAAGLPRHRGYLKCLKRYFIEGTPTCSDMNDGIRRRRHEWSSLAQPMARHHTQFGLGSWQRAATANGKHIVVLNKEGTGRFRTTSSTATCRRRQSEDGRHGHHPRCVSLVV